METGLDLAPVPEARRSSSIADVALLFAGANVVATTLVTGGALGVQASPGRTLTIVLLGVALGTAPLAVLARLGPRSGLPSMVLLRQPFGSAGAAAISLLLIVTNFAWIALNNVIAASALARLVGGPESGWSLLMGGLAVILALAGPRAMAMFDRFAVPAMAVLGGSLTLALLRGGGGPAVAPPPTEIGVLAGLDLVAGYQVSWSLMFADYTRFQRREGQASTSVFLGLSLSSAWLMLVGAAAARAGGGADPTAMILGLGLPAVALLVVALSTLTTNFVNLYLSSLALKNLAPRARGGWVVVGLGAVGTGFGLLSPGLLDRYAIFMGYLGTLLLPIVAITLVHFFVGARRPSPAGAVRPAAVMAWAIGVVVYQAVSRLWPVFGATIPTLIAAGVAYAALTLRSSAERRMTPCR